MIRPLFLAAASLILIVPSPAQSLSLRPTDDVWVYEHSVDPGGDPISRVWGDGTRSFRDSYPPGQEFSYTYLRFDLGSLSGSSYRVESAVLRITSRPAGYSRQAALANPLEARALGRDFTEATWNYADPTNPNPLGLFGSGDMGGHSTASDFVIPIDLNQNRSLFGQALNAAVKGDKKLKVALTSRLRVDDMGGQPYRLYTRDFPLVVRQPLLELTLRPGPEPIGGPTPVPEPATLSYGLIALGMLARRFSRSKSQSGPK
ncbi:MAG: hypothetical protein KF884_05410 [Fimbriimonadaceae bacterium]|nr:hypothetical protein [Fimbriimonadaceae bacterium]QYK59522.1 MAG: hypothetical protein KF884_05410 [Fimbriimonadaceae bacterium]